jgi:hypothetical protein
MEKIMIVCVSLFSGCALGITSHQQPLPVPVVASAGASNQNPCGLDYEHGGSESFHGVGMPVFYGDQYLTMMEGAGRFVKDCNIGQAVRITAEATREVVMHPYGTNPYWEAKTASASTPPASADEKKVKLAALKFYLETAAKLRNGQAATEETKSSPPASVTAAAPNLSDGLVAAKNYGELIAVLEREVSANTANSELCRSFARKLRIESVKENNDFGHDKAEVLKAF